MNTDLIDSLFSGCEVTVDCDSVVYLNKCRPGYCMVNLDEKTVLQLIAIGVLEESSGNFETGEVHYVLSDKYYSIKYAYNLGEFVDINLNLLLPALREIKINQIMR